MNDSVRLAKVWAELGAIKEKLDNEIIPVSGYLGIEDPELIIALEELSVKINNHFNKFSLIEESNKNFTKNA